MLANWVTNLISYQGSIVQYVKNKVGVGACTTRITLMFGESVIFIEGRPMKVSKNYKGYKNYKSAILREIIL